MSDAESQKLIANIQQATQLLSKGRRTDALLIYHELKQSAGSRAQVQYELGRLCEQIGDIDQAVTHYLIAVEEAPDVPQYVSTLGIAYLIANEHERAFEILERANALNPEMPEVLHGLGIYYVHRADYEQALGYLNRACSLKPSDANVHTILATCLRHLIQHDEALAHARKAVKLNDAKPGTHLALCEILTEIGQMDEARRHLEKLLRRHKGFGDGYHLFARIKKFSSADSAFIKRTEKVLEQGMPAKQRCSLHFALGKMHDDCGQYDDAFDHYQKANLLQKTDYDIGNSTKLLKDMKKAFSAANLESFAPLGHSSAQPVFIVGMPRSGTTLMEQMIASHPLGAGAGELPEIPRLAAIIFPADDRRRVSARARQELTANNIKDHAESFLNVLRQGRPDAERIVDKMPGNFFFVGLITTLFPNATIIHAIRHPLDICLSCYFQSFSALPWSNDFESIRTMYSTYRNAMDYWHRVLPDGKILDVHYEQLVDDPEHHARRMLEASGLEWDNIVLDFYRQESVVRTASTAQTRQPIYKSSKLRWMNYAAHIDELANGLAEYLQNDREILAESGIDLPTASTAGWLKRLLK